MIEFYYIDKNNNSYYRNYYHVSRIADEIWEILLEQYKSAELILHREDGPACFEIDNDTNEVILEWYYLFGKFIYKDEWKAIMNSSQENIVLYLLDDRLEIRQAAAIRLKQLER